MLSVAQLYSIRDRQSSVIFDLEIRVKNLKFSRRVRRQLGLSFEEHSKEIQVEKRHLAKLREHQKTIKKEIATIISSQAIKIPEPYSAVQTVLSGPTGGYLDYMNLIGVVGNISTQPAGVADYKPATTPAPSSGIGDINSDAKGTGARYNSGKPDLSLIPLTTLHDEARVWMYGAQKYKAYNWMKGMKWSVPLACALRHLALFQIGEENDEESGLPHLAHAMCNLRMLTLYAKTFREGDDRPPAEYFKE